MRRPGIIIPFLLGAACSEGGEPAAQQTPGRVPGSADAVAVEQLQDVNSSFGSAPEDVGVDVDGVEVALNQLELTIEPMATVAQVNEALDDVDARIVGSLPGLEFVLVELPRTQTIALCDVSVGIEPVSSPLEGQVADTIPQRERRNSSATIYRHRAHVIAFRYFSPRQKKWMPGSLQQSLFPIVSTIQPSFMECCKTPSGVRPCSPSLSAGDLSISGCIEPIARPAWKSPMPTRSCCISGTERNEGANGWFQDSSLPGVNVTPRLALAQARGETLGQAFSRLVRRGLEHDQKAQHDDNLPVFRVDADAPIQEHAPRSSWRKRASTRRGASIHARHGEARFEDESTRGGASMSHL